MGPRLEEIASKETTQGETAAGDANFHETNRVLRFLQERKGELPHPPLFAAHQGQCPLTVASCEAFREIIGFGRELGSAREGGLGFLGSESLGHHHRLAVGRLQVQTGVVVAPLRT